MGIIAYIILFLATALRQNQSSGRHDSKKSNKGDNCSQPRPTIKASFPESTERYRRISEKQQRYLQKQLVIATWLTFGAVFVYAGITLFIWCETKKSADAAQKAANTARDTLIASQRPWIGISADKPFVIDKLEFIPNPVKPNGGQALSLHVETTFWINNFGNSPARRISPAAFTAVPTADGSVPEQWQKMSCSVGEEISKGGTVPTFVVMPKSQILQHSEGWGGVPTSTTFHHIWLLGCFVYEDTLLGPLHHTRIIFHSAYSPSITPQFSLWDSEAD